MKQPYINRFAFYVSGRASRLLKVIHLYPEIIENTFLVINDEAPNNMLSSILCERKVEYVEFTYKERDLKGNEKNIYISNLLLKLFMEFKIDYSFCFGSRILKGDLLKTYTKRIINFHPAILPMFPGIKSIDQALNAKSFLLGNTAHFLDEGIDTGPIIMQSFIHASRFSEYEDVLKLQLPMIRQIYIWINQNRINFENNKVVISKANYNNNIFIPKLEYNDNVIL